MRARARGCVIVYEDILHGCTDILGISLCAIQQQNTRAHTHTHTLSLSLYLSIRIRISLLYTLSILIRNSLCARHRQSVCQT